MFGAQPAAFSWGNATLSPIASDYCCLIKVGFIDVCFAGPTLELEGASNASKEDIIDDDSTGS